MPIAGIQIWKLDASLVTVSEMPAVHLLQSLPRSQGNHLAAAAGEEAYFQTAYHSTEESLLSAQK
jgi:hypothetical protein